MCTENSTTYQPVNHRLPVSVCHEAIDALFPTLNPYSQKRMEIVQFIMEQFDVANCCVLYSVSNDFNTLCKKLGLNPGLQEVIIRENHSVVYTANYHMPPIKNVIFSF